MCDTSSGLVTVQLPPATPADDGKFVEVKGFPFVGPPTFNIDVVPAGGGPPPASTIDVLFGSTGTPFVITVGLGGTSMWDGVKFRVVSGAVGGAPDVWAAVLHYHYIGPP